MVQLRKFGRQCNTAKSKLICFIQIFVVSFDYESGWMVIQLNPLKVKLICENLNYENNQYGSIKK